MLELHDVSKTFNLGLITERRALHNINLTINDGDFVTVIGGNGAGKSTLLNLIAGVHSCDSGTIMLDSINITNMKEHKRAKFMGRVFQDPMQGTASNMEIEENMAMSMRRGKNRGLSWGISNKERALFKTILSTLDLGLEDRMKSKVGLLSGGQRQALTLLMATMKKPRLLLLDEHTAALDPRTAHKVLELTQSIIEKDNLSAFMVTHNMKHAIHYGNRLIMMLDGSIIFDVKGIEKQKLNVQDLLKKFETVSGNDTAINDRMLLN